MRGVGDRLRRPIGLTLALLLTLASAACGSPPNTVAVRAAAATPAPRQVIFVGDSLTVGLYATTADNSFASLVAADWHARLLDRLGIAGVHADGLVTAIGTLPAGATDVIVEAGTNDFLDDSLADFDTGYRALIAAIRLREPQARFTCLGLWRNPIDERTPWGQGAQAYDDVIGNACPGRFVALSRLFVDSANREPAGVPTFRGRSDGFHPNDTGHAAIAMAVEQADGGGGG